MNEISLNGETYELDAEQAIKIGVLKPKFMPYKAGQRFHQKFGNQEYILACAGTDSSGSTMLLVNLCDGRRWSEPFVVKDSRYITQKEFDGITDQDKDFTLVKG